MTTAAPIYRDVTTDNDLRNAVCQWLTANGIDARRVPAGERPRLTDMRRAFPRTEHGAPMVLDVRLWDYDEQDRPRMNTDRTEPSSTVHTIPITVPPPPAIQAWLDSRCPTCLR